jgi:hypothetical protein
MHVYKYVFKEEGGRTHFNEEGGRTHFSDEGGRNKEEGRPFKGAHGHVMRLTVFDSRARHAAIVHAGFLGRYSRARDAALPHALLL